MNLDFDFNNIKTTEFGVGRNDGNAQSFCCVAVDGNVQAALRDVAAVTWNGMLQLNEAPSTYDPSEKYASVDYVQLPLDHDLAKRMRKFTSGEQLTRGYDCAAKP